MRTPEEDQIRDEDLRTPEGDQSRGEDLRTPEEDQIRNEDVRTPEEDQIRDEDLREMKQRAKMKTIFSSVQNKVTNQSKAINSICYSFSFSWTLYINMSSKVQVSHRNKLHYSNMKTATL